MEDENLGPDSVYYIDGYAVHFQSQEMAEYFVKQFRSEQWDCARKACETLNKYFQEKIDKNEDENL